MSIMADQGDNKDALLDKLDSLMKSGRARKQLDPPPLLTDTIPNASESTIPTLTDAVEIPDTAPKARADNEAVGLPEDTSIDFEQDKPVDAADDTSIDFARDTSVDLSEDTSIDFERDTPVDLQEVISSRLLAVIDREMESLSEELAAHESKLSVLHRSIRYALPELVRLRWLEAPDTDSDTDADEVDATEQ